MDTQVTTKLQMLIEQSRTITLATVNTNGEPNASYAPFIHDELGDFYVFISDIALHTQNILANSKASLMVIEDESESNQIFARRRITLNCKATEFMSDSDTYQEKIKLFSKHHGEIVESLTHYQDFHLFQLRPSNGRAVLGFGETYYIEGGELATHHIQNIGHRKA